MNKYSDLDIKLLKEKYQDSFQEIEQKLNEGYPIQYLIGNVEFIDTFIEVNSSVLIPRFETENLAYKTAAYAKERFNKKIDIIDLGCGSGCIAIYLKKHLDSNVTALDISPSALEVARKNAIINKQDITFINGDMSDELTSNYDIIISNPPYIKHDGFVEDSVLKYEPNLALFAEDNGLYFYKKIIINNMKHLNKNGFMAFEIGDDEKDQLEEFLKENNILNYEFFKDLNNLDRYLFIFNE